MRNSLEYPYMGFEEGIPLFRSGTILTKAVPVGTGAATDQSKNWWPLLIAALLAAKSLKGH